MPARGGFTSKILARCDTGGRPLAFVITGGEASDGKQLTSLRLIDADIPAPRNLLAEAGYDSDANRDELLKHSTGPLIHTHPTRKHIPSLDKLLSNPQSHRTYSQQDKAVKTRRDAVRKDRIFFESACNARSNIHWAQKLFPQCPGH
jgi:IS5 family transposase